MIANIDMKQKEHTSREHEITSVVRWETWTRPFSVGQSRKEKEKTDCGKESENTENVNLTNLSPDTVRDPQFFFPSQHQLRGEKNQGGKDGQQQKKMEERR